MTIDAAFTHFPSLTTNRLLLRQIQPHDAEAFFAILFDEESMAYYGHEPHKYLITIRKPRQETEPWQGYTKRHITSMLMR